MLDILRVTFPFFALVLGGYVAARVRFLPLDAIPGLNTFVLYFALPCMLYRFGANTPVAQLFDLAALAVYVACAVALVFAIVFMGRSRGWSWNDAAFGALVAAFPNSGFMGVPLLVTLLGSAAAGPAILTLLLDLLVTCSLCIAVSRMDGAGEHGAREALKNSLRSVAVNPLPWAIVMGAASSLLQVRPWQPLGDTIDLLGAAASPVALFTIGAVLARSQMAARQAPAARDASYLALSTVKLLVHPVLVFVVGAAAIRLGLGLEKFSLTVMVLVAALPSASNVSVLAERFGADSGRIARVILVSTAVSFFTFSAAVSLLQ